MLMRVQKGTSPLRSRGSAGGATAERRSTAASFPTAPRLANLLKGTAFRVLAAALAVSGLAACFHGAPTQSAAHSVPNSSLHVAVEGFCSKLALARLANRTIIVHGRAGDQPGEVSETFTEIVGTSLHPPVDLLSGLPVDPRGYVPEDLELFGWWPNATLLRRTRLERLPIGGPIDIEEVKSLRRWNGKWIDERHPSSAGACPGAVPEHCFRTLASQVLPSSREILVGTCGDCRTKMPQECDLVALRDDGPAWDAFSLPDARGLGPGCARASLAVSSTGEVYLAASGDDERSAAYVARFDGRAWSLIAVPFTGPATAVAEDEKGTLWVTAGGALWNKPSGAAWTQVPLPGPSLPGAPAGEFRASGLEARTGDGVWIEVAHEKDPSYRALLRTQRPSTVLRCDQGAPADKGLVPVR